jgi:hypothetical protein
MGRTTNLAGIAIPLLLGFFLFLMPGRAQQQDSSGTPTKDDLPKPTAKTTVLSPTDDTLDDPNAAANAPSGPPNPYAGGIKDAGTGLPLLGNPGSPLRWGDFSIRSFEYIGIHDRFDPAGQTGSIATNLSILRTGLMFDHYIRRIKNRIVLQYLPQMAITDGQIHANAGTNNTLSLGMSFDLTPRLNVTLQDTFLQVHSNPLLPENFLAADGKEVAPVQNNFLDTYGSFLSDTASATFQYGLSPRTTITFIPLYRYAHATDNRANYLADGQTYAGFVSVGHALSPHRTIGATESYEYLLENTASVPASAKFNTVGFFYSEQLARSLWVTGHIGAEHQSLSDLPRADHWGMAAGFSLVDNISRKMGLALAYTRGITFNNYISLQKADRIDASIGFIPTSRISWNGSVGYLRELGADPRTNGKYAASELDYRFFGRFSLFTTYAYTFQKSNTLQLFEGQRKTLAYGLRWRPAPIPGR